MKFMDKIKDRLNALSRLLSEKRKAEGTVAAIRFVLTESWDRLLTGIGWLHKWIAFGFVWLFHQIGRGLGYIPWGMRGALAALIASAILLPVILLTPAFLLLRSPVPPLDSYADRNANKIVFSDAGQGESMVVLLYEFTPEQKKWFAELKEECVKNDGGMPNEKQLKLVGNITGVGMEVLDGAQSVSPAEVEETVRFQFLMEKSDGSNGEAAREILSPTKEQNARIAKLTVSERFEPGLIPELAALFPEDEAGKRQLVFSEVRAVKVSRSPALLRLAVMLQQQESEALEKIEFKFEEDNTVKTFPLGQYGAFLKTDLGSVVDRELAAMNARNQKLFASEKEQELTELRKQADLAIQTARQTLGKISEQEQQRIYAEFAKKAVKTPPAEIRRESLKQSDIEGWFTKRYQASKFNPDNLRYDINQLAIIYDRGLLNSINSYCNWPAKIVLLLLWAGIIMGVACTFLRFLRKSAYWVLLAGGAAFAAYWFILIFMAFDLPDGLMAAAPKKEIFDSAARNAIWFEYLWLWLPAAVFSFFTWFPLLLSSARQYFLLPLRKRELGDVLAKNLQCKGENPGFYRSTWWVLFYHFFFLLVLPLCLKGCYDEDEYSIPKGDGGGQIQPQQVQKEKKKKKKKKRYTLNPNSEFIFDIPELPDEQLVEELDAESAQTYTATSGTFGPGKKAGGKPGWPNGMDNGKIRFVRLKYSGGDWDQDMGKGSDYNMLIKIRDWTGFTIASETEFISIDELENRFRNKKKKPPFVYITGRGGISVTPREKKQLRDYLIRDGGMLFADNGGGNFDRSIRSLLKQVLPNHDLVDIANDDMIYQQPFYFPNGAPPLWHHSGTRALGIKNNGRWIVFYHQGDINDAWKTGASGASPQTQEMAFRLGANVICYAFGEYLKAVYGDAMQ